jgi:hypothetical protein
MLYKAEATVDDIDELEQNLREEDRREIDTLTGGLDPFFCLIESFRLSNECWVVKAKNENKVVMVYGCLSDGRVWAMATPLITNYKIKILRHTKEEVGRLLSTYKLLYNIVDSRNEVHIKWLSYAGFSFGESQIINGVEFISIVKEI